MLTENFQLYSGPGPLSCRSLKGSDLEAYGELIKNILVYCKCLDINKAFL